MVDCARVKLLPKPAGKVHNIRVAVTNSTIVLKGTVSPSQRSGTAYTCWVAVEDSGRILDADCTCMAG